MLFYPKNMNQHRVICQLFTNNLEQCVVILNSYYLTHVYTVIREYICIYNICSLSENRKKFEYQLWKHNFCFYRQYMYIVFIKSQNNGQIILKRVAFQLFSKMSSVTSTLCILPFIIVFSIMNQVPQDCNLYTRPRRTKRNFI